MSGIRNGRQQGQQGEQLHCAVWFYRVISQASEVGSWRVNRSDDRMERNERVSMTLPVDRVDRKRRSSDEYRMRPIRNSSCVGPANQ